jgi:hypothetical protein
MSASEILLAIGIWTEISIIAGLYIGPILKELGR